MIDAVVFDCDGVTVDSDGLQVQAEQETALIMAEERGVELDIDQLNWSRFRGWGRVNIAAELFGPDSELGEAYREAVIETTVRIACQDNLRCIDDFVQFAPYLLQRGCVLGLATSSNRRIYAKYCEVVPINHFQATVAHNEALDNKPKPGPFREVMRRLNVDAQNTLVIEDSATGITAGRFAGALVLGLATTESSEYLKQATDAHLVAANFRQAAHLLQPYLP